MARLVPYIHDPKGERARPQIVQSEEVAYIREYKDMAVYPTDSTDVSVLSAYLEHALHRVDAALDGYLPEVNSDPGTGCPARLASAIRYSVLGGGKRLRPVLCLMASEACGGDIEAALPAACAWR